MNKHANLLRKILLMFSIADITKIFYTLYLDDKQFMIITLKNLDLAEF